MALFHRVQKGPRFQQSAALLRAQAEWAGPFFNGFGVAVDNQPRPDLGAEPVAKLYHFAELVGGVHVQQRERDGSRIERLLRQTHHYRRIFADGIEHHRPLEFGCNFAQNMDALGFQGAQMCKGPFDHLE